MKQLFKFTLSAVLSLLALSACNDDLQTMTDVSQPNPTNDPTACILVADDFRWDEADTRTSLTVEDDVALFSWTTGDRVGILPDAGAQVYFAIPELATPADGEGDDEQAEQRLNASFDGGAWALKPESEYAAYYPFIKDFDLNRTAVPVDYTGQKQTGNGSTAHLGAFDFMGARPVTTNGGGGVAFDFDHVGALVQLKFLVPDAGTALKSVAVTADNATFTVKGTYDLTNEEGFPITAAAEGGTSDEMIIGLDYTTTTEREWVTVYFMCAPIDLTDKYVNVCVAYGEEDDVLYFETKGKDLQAGRGSRLQTESSIPYLTFTADEEQVLVPSECSAEILEDLEYCVGDEGWNMFGQGGYIYFGGELGRLRLRGSCESGTAISNDDYFNITFENDIPVACRGDIRTLVDRVNYKTVDTSEAKFIGLFRNCSVLTSAPDLPATTLAKSCYEQMFLNCTSLTSAPDLPATELAEDCYRQMFLSCTSLTSAPDLPATTLAANCYYSMFSNCTSLTTAPDLPATKLAVCCYDNMFYNCISLTTAPALPATTLATYCYRNMFYGCTSLTVAPALPAEILAEGCYYQMFRDCTSLTTAPALPAKTLAIHCYDQMFFRCSSLTTAPALPATTLTNFCYAYMFKDCTLLTTAPALPAETLEASCYNGMFSGCISLTAAPVLSAKTMVQGCYYNMFQACRKLSSITMLATNIDPSCMHYWVDGVAASGTFTKAKGVEIENGIDGIPSGWTVKEQE